MVKRHSSTHFHFQYFEIAYLLFNRRLAYNFTQLYNVPDVNPIALHNIAMQFLTQPLVFKNYFAVNHMLRDNLPYCGKICKQVHFCAATQIDYLR